MGCGASGTRYKVAESAPAERSTFVAQHKHGRPDVLLHAHHGGEQAKVPNGTRLALVREAGDGEHWEVQVPGLAGTHLVKRWHLVPAPSPGPSAPLPAGACIAKPDIDLSDKASLIRFLKWANIRLLDGLWIAYASIEDLMKMRQDLPEEAFVPEDQLPSMCICALSYAWQSAAHPDPHGQIAKAVKQHFPRHHEHTGDTVLFWDHKSLYQKEMKGDFNPKVGHKFSDYVIRNRTVAEQHYFNRALSGMHSLYFHESTHGLVIEDVPEGALNPTPYNCRGWPLLESAGLALNKAGLRMPLLLCVDDFTRELDKREFTGNGDRALVVELFRHGMIGFQASAKKIDIYIPTHLIDQRRLAAFLNGFKQLKTTFVHLALEFDAMAVHDELKEAILRLRQQGAQVVFEKQSPLGPHLYGLIAAPW